MAGSNHSNLKIFRDEDCKKIIKKVRANVLRDKGDYSFDKPGLIIKIACLYTIDEVLTRLKLTHTIVRKEVPKDGITE